jgi:hypothetical protein
MSKRNVSAKGGAMPAEGPTTRRTALGVLAGASALAIPTMSLLAAAALSDPIFAAIERHSAAWRVVERLSPTIDVVAAMREGREITQADCEASERGSAMEEQALNLLLNTAPTTAAGMRAAIQYLFCYDDGRLPDNIGQFLVTVLKSPLLIGDARR